MHRKVVVLGLCTPGATILRNLSRKGYRVWGVADDKTDEGLHSFYGKKLLSPNCERNFKEWLQFLINLAREIGERPVLIPTGDKYVVAIEKGIAELGKHYRLHQSKRKL